MWKPMCINPKILKNLYKGYCGKKLTSFNIYNKSSIVPNLFQMSNEKILPNANYVYKGLSFIKVPLSKFYIGHKWGEFSINRKTFRFPEKKKKKK